LDARILLGSGGVYILYFVATVNAILLNEEQTRMVVDGKVKTKIADTKMVFILLFASL